MGKHTNRKYDISLKRVFVWPTSDIILINIILQKEKDTCCEKKNKYKREIINVGVKNVKDHKKGETESTFFLLALSKKKNSMSINYSPQIKAKSR